ncbi:MULTISPECIES: hypothetical protein [Erysipelotrichaceae]|jgi:hypothetical protein|nr:hypothetical protein [Absiella sp. AM29-15]
MPGVALPENLKKGMEACKKAITLFPEMWRYISGAVHKNGFFEKQ